MDNDDTPIGRLLNRREVLALFGGAAAILVVGACSDDSPAATPTAVSTPTTAGSAATDQPAAATNAPGTSVVSCVAKPALTEGPYFVDEKLNRSDIRAEPSTGAVKEGAVLTLAFTVFQAATNACTPLAGATVDIWHCDALGVYSDASDPGFNTKGQKFLRGYQVTDATGKAQFVTIFPGWYRGRAVHIHFKVRTTTAAGRAYDFTSQLFFDDALADEVYAQAPYSTKGQRTLRNNGDGIFQQGGSQLLVPIAKSGSAYSGAVELGITLT